MSSLTASEAFEILRFAQAYSPRLEQAADLLETKQAPEVERAWLDQSLSRLAEQLRTVPPVLERARALPDLAETVQALAVEDQGRWVDTLEKLVAGITFTASSRSPLIEALLPNQKWPALRRAAREDVTRFQVEFERRAKTGYVTRMLGSDDLTVVRPVMEQVSAAYARWLACFSPAPLGDAEAYEIRAELRAAAERVDLVVRQSRLLAEAALLAFEGSFEELGLHAKPKKRASRGDVAAELAMLADAMESPGEGQPSPEEEEGVAEAEELEAQPTERAAAETGEPPAAGKKRGRRSAEGEIPEGPEAGAPKKGRKKRAEATAAPDASEGATGETDPGVSAPDAPPELNAEAPASTPEV
ncbi:MAG: hypothetical protein M3Y59_19490 [Myxococcota bacterium]|nr:hypothetical protein [Myxococcota bacterium]